MAYVRNWQDDEQQQGPMSGGAPKQNTSGVMDGQTQADPNAPGGTAAPTPASTQQTGPGSGFVNLHSYIDANQGEGARMVKDATKSLTDEASQYGDTVGKTVADQQKAMQAATGSDKVGALQAGIKQDASGNASAASDFLGAGYGGPTAAASETGLAATQKDLDSRLQGANSNTVVDALKNKGGPYTNGFGLLDSFLTGNDKGQAALNAVHNRAAGVDAAYAGGAGQLDASEAAARAQLGANQQALRGTAQGQMDSITGAGAKKVADMNRGLDTTNYDGVVQHSLAGGLSDKDRLDLDALAGLTGGAKGDWYNDTYKAGTANTKAADAKRAADEAAAAQTSAAAEKAADQQWQHYNAATPQGGGLPTKSGVPLLKAAANSVIKPQVAAAEAIAKSPQKALDMVKNTPLPSVPLPKKLKKPKW